LLIAITNVLQCADAGVGSDALGIGADIGVRGLGQVSYCIDEPACCGHPPGNRDVGKDLERSTSANFFIQLVDSVFDGAWEFASDIIDILVKV